MSSAACTVVIGRNSPSWLVTARTIAVSAAAISVWPDITPPEWTCFAVTGSASSTSPGGLEHAQVELRTHSAKHGGERVLEHGMIDAGGGRVHS
jgi:hypothetical protein